MSLRKRTFLTVAAVLCAISSLWFILAWTALHSKFLAFEQSVLLRNLQRTELILSDDVSALRSTARDWGGWNVTYDFLETADPAYIHENLSDATFANLRAGFMVFLDPAGRLVYGKGLCLETRRPAPLPSTLAQELRTVVTSPPSGEISRSGYLALPEGIAVLAVSPILHSNGSGPLRGFLAVGRILTTEEVRRIESLSYLKLTVGPAQHTSWPPEVTAALAELQRGRPRVARMRDFHNMDAYTLLEDLHGNRSILLRVSMEREAYQFRFRTWLSLVGFLFLLAVAATAATMAVLERQVLARLTRLNRGVKEIEARGDPTARVAIDNRRDELTGLAGSINGMLQTLQRSQEDLRRSDAVARALLDAPNDPAILLERDGAIIGLNRHAAERLHRPVSELIGSGGRELLPPDLYESRRQAIHQVIETAEPVAAEDEQDGCHYAHSLYPILDESGQVIQIAVFSRDITQQKRDAQALRDSEQRYRSFVENSHGIVFQAGPDGLPTLCEGNVERITGYTEEELLAGAPHWRQIVYPEDLPALDKAWAALIACPSSSSEHRCRIVCKDGAVRWIQVFVQSLPAREDRLPTVQGILYDITESVVAEQALRESLQATADIVRAVPAGLFTYRNDPHGRLVLLDANPEAERLTGISLEDCRGMEFRELWPGLDTPEVLGALLNVLATGEIFEAQELEYADDRFQGAFHVRAFRLPGDKLGIAIEDIAARRQAEAERQYLEEQLHHSQKMEAIGQLAGGVAHDFNNLLSGILGYASLLKLEAGSDGNVQEAARVIEQAAERAAELTRQLLGFARRGKFQNVGVDLHDTVQEVIRLLGRTLDKNIRIVQQFRAPQHTVLGDPNQLQQVFVNLAINARDAMPAGGDLTFESHVVNVDDVPEAWTRGNGRPHVVVSVIDVGCGIPKEHLGRIFEPFFTTKEQGKGTGMGLAMVYGIVRNHGGFVRVLSEPNRGTTFRVYLPLASEAVASDMASSLSEPPVHGAAHILLVDDEAVIRNMGSTVLSRLGYTVATAANGREAVDYYREHASDVDLAIIDMVMPEMGGQACYRALKAINPGVRAVLSSGYGFDGKASELLDEGMLGFIQKPYRVTELSVAVAKALNAGSI